MIKFNSVMFFASSMFAGFLFTTDSMASLDNATPAKTATVPVQPEMLIEKANVAPSDASITMAVLKILRQADALNIAVVAKKGQVTLIGFVPTSEDRNRIITRIEKVEGVRKVKAEAFAATTLNPGFER